MVSSRVPRPAGKRGASSRLFDSSDRFQLLVDAIKDYAVYLLDRDGNVASWNSGARRFKGYEADEIIGQHFSRFYTAEDRAAGLPERALRIAAEEGKFEGEGWRVHKNGTRFWTSVVIDPVIDADGEVIGFAKVTRDITDQKDAQQALFESEQRFRMLVQGVRDYAIYMLDLNGIITNWNSGAEAIKGYSADEIIGQHFSRFYTEEDRRAGEPARALEKALRDGKYEREAWRVRKDGTHFWANILIDPIHNEVGELVGFAKVTRDVTERKLAEEAIEKAREELVQAQKLEAIGRLTGGVAHDFNNMLTIIRSSIDLLRRPDLAEEKRARYFEAIAETADRAAALTGQLLAFARRQPLRPESFNVANRIHGLREIIKASLGSPIELVLDLPEELGEVEADPNQFETAILNIVINARDAMASGGTMRIGGAAVPRLPGQDGPAGKRRGYIAIALQDSGTGIQRETLSRIFEPFFTTKAVNKGTGLGLSQVYGFVKQSGGDITVESEPGRGSTFTIYLPRSAGRHSGDEAPDEQKPIEDSPALSVLLVEDNEQVGEFARALLTELGQRVTWVTHGRAALDLLHGGRAEIDIVFSDVVMPGISGVDLATEIARQWPDLPVVLTSGYSETFADKGCEGFDLLHKPYSAEAVLAVLRKRIAAKDR